VIGLGGLIFPQALGVGYSTINALLQGNVAVGTILGILIVKSIIWSVSLGSGTSGGVLAPLLMMGGALGGILALVLPFEGTGFWELIAMAAILGGTMRSPFTGVIFTLELTHDVNALLPLLVACVIAHGFTVLALKRSILTEKVARRGYHLSREYAVDPLEIMFAREVVRRGVVALPADATLATAESALAERVGTGRHEQRLFPVVDTEQGLVGAITRQELRRWIDSAREGRALPLATAIGRKPVVAYEDDSLRAIVFRMAETGLTRLPVITRADGKLAGMIALNDLLLARARTLEAEQRRERVFDARIRLPRVFKRSA
jgi:CBS domain-containing protein